MLAAEGSAEVEDEGADHISNWPMLVGGAVLMTFGIVLLVLGDLALGGLFAIVGVGLFLLSVFLLAVETHSPEDQTT